jgi:hypothetical protein
MWYAPDGRGWRAWARRGAPDGQDRRVDEADIGVCVAVADLADPGVVSGLEIFDRVSTVLHIGEERN